MSSKSKKKWKQMFEDVLARFVHTLPSSEKESERLFIQLEQAHWFYEDHVRAKNKNLPKMALRDFCLKAFDVVDFLRPEKSKFEAHWLNFKQYLKKVPTCGAIILNQKLSKVVMVQAYNTDVWAFPKGKINRNEEPKECAIREVMEETGLDIAEYVRPKGVPMLEGQDEKTGRIIRLYIVRGYPEDCEFETQTVKEISAIEWIPIKKIQDFFFNRRGSKPSKEFWPIKEFFPCLKAWIKGERKKPGSKQDKHKASAQKGPPGQVPRSKSNNNHEAVVQTPERPTRTGSRKNHSQISRAQSASKPRKSVRRRNRSIKSARNSPNHRENSHKEYRRPKDEAYDALDDSIFGHNTEGWSAEEMFKYNEAKFGLKSSVPADDITEEERASIKHIPRTSRRSSNKTRSKERKSKHTPQRMPPKAKTTHSALPDPFPYYDPPTSHYDHYHPEKTAAGMNFSFNSTAILSTLQT